MAEESLLIGLVIASGLALIFIFLMFLSCYCAGMCRFAENKRPDRRPPPPMYPPPTPPMYPPPPPPAYPPSRPPSRHHSMKVVHPMPIETKAPPGPSIMMPRESGRDPHHTFLKVQL